MKRLKTYIRVSCDDLKNQELDEVDPNEALEQYKATNICLGLWTPSLATKIKLYYKVKDRGADLKEEPRWVGDSKERKNCHIPRKKSMIKKIGSKTCATSPKDFATAK